MLIFWYAVADELNSRTADRPESAPPPIVPTAQRGFVRRAQLPPKSLSPAMDWRRKREARFELLRIGACLRNAVEDFAATNIVRKVSNGEK